MPCERKFCNRLNVKFKQVRHAIYRHAQGGPKMAPFIVRFITSPNINRFSKCFHCQNQETICNETVAIDPPHLKCVATLPSEMSDDALKAATPLTSCMINVDRVWHVVLKQPGQLCCSGCPSTDDLSMLTIHDSQPARESRCR